MTSMDAAELPTGPGPAGAVRDPVPEEPQPFRFGRRDHVINLGFWTLFGAVTAANFLSNDYEPAGYRRVVPETIYWLFQSYLWAAATPLIFWLVWRFRARRSDAALRALPLLGAGIAILVVVSLIRDAVWEHVLGFPPRSGIGHDAPGGARWGGLWERLEGEGVMCASIFVMGFVREHLLRLRARDEHTIRLQAHAAQLQGQLAQARLAVLRSQLNPHFLFNTLNAISVLVHDDPRSAKRMIARLSDLLRYALQERGGEEIPLREELRLTRHYLEILEIRFQGRLHTEVSADAGTLEALVPHLILQPLVENAMKHGVGKAGGRGRIEVQARRDGGALVLTVRDSGGGANADGPAELDATGGGVGLTNTRARLRELYGSEQRFSLMPTPEGGMAAEVVLPFRTADVPVPA